MIGIFAVNQNAKAGAPPVFAVEYFRDSNLTISMGNSPKLRAGTYYIKITTEALVSTPTITIAAEGTANDITNAATVLISTGVYEYTRTIAYDVAAVGSVRETFGITGTNAFGTSSGAQPTNWATAPG